MQINIGKNSLTEGIITALKNAFKNHENIKISVLKSGGHEREKIKQMAENIVAKLGKNFTYRIIGFTISLKKWRRTKRFG